MIFRCGGADLGKRPDGVQQEDLPLFIANRRFRGHGRCILQGMNSAKARVFGIGLAHQVHHRLRLASGCRQPQP
jgi:hypothetical protein